MCSAFLIARGSGREGEVSIRARSFDTRPRFRYASSTGLGNVTKTSTYHRAGSSTTPLLVLPTFAFENGLGGCLQARSPPGESFANEVQPIVLGTNNVGL